MLLCSMDSTGKPLSVEKEVVEGNDTRCEVSTEKEVKRSISENIPAQPFSCQQDGRSSSDAATIKHRVLTDGGEPLAAGITTVQLENSV